jgi:hypothetical protein
MGGGGLSAEYATYVLFVCGGFSKSTFCIVLLLTSLVAQDTLRRLPRHITTLRLNQTTPAISRP